MLVSEANAKCSLKGHSVWWGQLFPWHVLSWLMGSPSAQLYSRRLGVIPESSFYLPLPLTHQSSGFNLLTISQNYPLFSTPNSSALRSALSIWHAGIATVYKTQGIWSSPRAPANSMSPSLCSCFLLFLNCASPLIHFPFLNLSKFNSDITSCRNHPSTPHWDNQPAVCSPRSLPVLSLA